MIPAHSILSRRVLIPAALVLTLAGAVLAGMPTTAKAPPLKPSSAACPTYAAR